MFNFIFIEVSGMMAPAWSRYIRKYYLVKFPSLTNFRWSWRGLWTNIFLNNYFSLNNLISPLQFTNKPTAKVQVQPVKGLDFTDDPFRDYRYEDLCNISFDDEPPTDEKKSTTSTPADAFSSIHFNTKDNFDPFGLDGRQSVPLPNSAPFVSVSGRASAPVSSELLSEDQQLAWAASESLKLEEERKKRQLQEEADFKLAISLSKAES